MKKYLIISSLLFLLFGCSSSNYLLNESSDLINERDLRANLEFLASDELEGREATTRGEQLAALFISTELQKYGVKPFGDDGSYFQKYKLNSKLIDTTSTFTLIDSANNKITYNFLKDFILFPERASKLSASGNIVFASYGIDAPEFDYNNYNDINVEGKFVIILSGEPESEDTSFFAGGELTGYARERSKISTAKIYGAIGVITIASDWWLNMWDRFARYLKNPSLSFPSEENVEQDNFIALTIKNTLANELLNYGPYSLEEINELAKSGKEIPVFEISAEAKINISVTEEEKTSMNIVGLIEGNNEKLKDQMIAIGAHYDHLGIRDGVVYNGADDDGSGTVSVMEIAKAFSKTKTNERSILIVFHAAEEKGLYGSRYLTNYADYIDKIITQLNIDMIGRGSEDSIYIIGSDKLSSELDNLINQVNNETVNIYLNYKFNSEDDPNKFYYRSDHYNYAKKGIPIAFFYDNMQEDYHKPTDDADKINFEKLDRVATLIYNIALNISNLDHKIVVDKENKD